MLGLEFAESEGEEDANSWVSLWEMWPGEWVSHSRETGWAALQAVRKQRFNEAAVRSQYNQ